MSWFQKKSIVKEVGQSNDIFIKEWDPNVCLMSFCNHWKLITETIERSRQQNSLSRDDMLLMISNLEQIGAIVMLDLRNSASGPIMKELFQNQVLETLNEYVPLLPVEYSNVLKLETLKLYEIIICNIDPKLLEECTIVPPLLNLLKKCCNNNSVEVKKRLLILLNQICVLIVQHEDLLGLFFSENTESLIILSTLNMMVYHEGGIGQQARDALLLCLSSTKNNFKVANSIVNDSNFCPIIASTLSALFSLLPRKIEILNEDWIHLTTADVQSIPELENFISYLDFCDAALQVSHKIIKESILKYIYNGFLELVLGPAIFQDLGCGSPCSLDETYLSNSIEEILAATSYLELFLRTIKEPCLLQIFLKFLLVKKIEGQFLLDVIIGRLKENDKLAVISLSLLKVLINLNCEDVMMQLVFKHLIPCTHIMLSQQSSIKMDDFGNYLPETFLHLVPKCSETYDALQVSGLNSVLYRKLDEYLNVPDSNFSQSNEVNQLNYETKNLDTNEAKKCYYTSYFTYLHKAKLEIEKCWHCCQYWAYKYDGLSPSCHESFTVPNLNASTTGKPSWRRLSDSNLMQDKPNLLFNKLSDRNEFNRESWYLDSNIPVNKESNLCGTKETLDSLGNSSGYESFSNRHDSRGQSPDDIENKYSILFDCDMDSTNPSSEVSDMENTLNEIDKLICDFSVTSCDSLKSINYIEKSMDVCVTSEMQNNLTISRSLSQDYSSTQLEISKPDIGAFFNSLFRKLENLLNNSLTSNIQLLSVITRLAIYPQPLLKSFLLSTTYVFQPTVKSLLQILASLKYKIDLITSKVPNMNWYMTLAHLYLRERDKFLSCQENNYHQFHRVLTKSKQSRKYLEKKPKDSRKKSITERFFKRSAPDSKPGKSESAFEVKLESLNDSVGFRKVKTIEQECLGLLFDECPLLYVGVCSILLTEWLQEMAAISQEHCVLSSCCAPVLNFFDL